MSSRLWITLLVPALAIAPLHSQTSSGITFKAETRIVLVDVVVTDSKGNPVPNLQKSNFQIFEDGRPQTISFFEEHKKTKPVPVNLPPMPPHVFTNFRTMPLLDSVNVLLLDWLNTQPQDQPYVRAQITQYLQTLPPGTPLAIFSLSSGLHIVRGFTSDLSGLIASLRTNNGPGAPEVSPLLPTDVGEEAEKEMIRMMQMNLTSAAAIEAAKREMAEHAASDIGERIEITLQAFQKLARYLSTIPGRKNVIWFAGSFPITFFPDRGTPQAFASELQKTADILTPSRVSVYPVSATGLGSPCHYKADNTCSGPQGASLRSENFTRAGNQLAMEKLARDTGGEAFYNTNDLAHAITRAVNDGSRYYTLTYTPTKKKLNGRYRSIDVKLKDENYRLSYRRGYYADPPQPQNDSKRGPASDHLLPFIAFGLPNFDQILYKIRAVPSNPQPAPHSSRAGMNANLPGPFTRYGVDFAISVDDLKLKAAADGMRHDTIEEMLIAYGPDGTPLNAVAKNIQLAIAPKAYAAYQKSGLQLHQEIDVPDGQTYLRTGIYDANSGDVGTLQIPLTPAHSH
jgi:VWFA-related protein